MTDQLDIDEELAFAASFGNPDAAALADGFNQYGVRENTDEEGNLRSVDVNYEAMEPGEPEDRNGVRITEEFLRTVANKDYSGDEPFMLDHTRKTLSKAGAVRDVWFSDEAGKLMVQSRIPNTGAKTHTELIKRFTYDPPTVTNGSVGFGDSYEAVRNDDGEPELVDGTLQEFSTTPFPGGYDEGGLRAAFAESAVEAVEETFAVGSTEEVYNQYNSLVNMSEDDLDEWAGHPCSDISSVNAGDPRTLNQMLIGTPLEGWDAEYVKYATETIEFIENNMDDRPQAPRSGATGSCPSRWAMQMMNHAFNPFDEIPEGRPHNGDYTEVETFEIDDGPQVKSSREVGSENSEVAVFAEELSF